MGQFRTNYAGLPLPMKPQTGSLTRDEALALLCSTPCAIQKKLDGINGRTWKGRMWSVSGKPIANKYVQALAVGLPEGLHGELMWHKVATHGLQAQPIDAPLNEINSIVSSRDNALGKEIIFEIYDTFDRPTLSYRERYDDLWWMFHAELDGQMEGCALCYTHFASSTDPGKLAEWLDAEIAEAQNYHGEGIIIRPLEQPYHFGRCSKTHPSLFRLKFFEEFEAHVIGFKEAYTNCSEAEENTYGQTKRASSMELREPKGELGALVLESIPDKIMFECGTGFTSFERGEIWKNRKNYMGRIVTVKRLQNGGKDKPRNPVFKAFRDPSDMTLF